VNKQRETQQWVHGHSSLETDERTLLPPLLLLWVVVMSTGVGCKTKQQRKTNPSETALNNRDSIETATQTRTFAGALQQIPNSLKAIGSAFVLVLEG